jgi:hypothetical protein
MAEDKPLSTKDLFLLLVGLRKLDKPGPKTSPKKYYLKDDGSLRDSSWNWDWLSKPDIEINKVPYPDWLMANIAANLTGRKQDFSAISEPVFVSLDLLSKEFRRDMPDASDAIKKMAVSKNGYDRSFLTTLSLGLSVQRSDNKDVVVFGAGMRRRTKVWRSDEAQALQADVEFFVPFYVFPTRGSSPDSLFPNARSICAGIAITRQNGSSIELDSKKNNLAAARFNFRIPFTVQTSPGELVTDFGQPVIEAQKQLMSSEPVKWEKFDDWKSFIKSFCKDNDGSELLSAPIGPLLLDTISDDSGIKDIILNKKKRQDIKEDLKKAKKELDDAVKLLRRLVTPEEDEEGGSGGPSGSSERQLGGLLMSLGLLEGEPGKYGPSDLDGLTVWDVANRMIDELDGFPLYLSGVDPKAPDGKRMAFALAAQSDELDSNKHYFGLAGLFYNILLAAIPKGAPDTKTENPDTTTIVLDEENFPDDDTIFIDDEDAADEDAEVEQAEAKEKEEDKPKKKGSVELRLHLGKWFDGETLDDNWFRRLLPPPESLEGPEWKRRVPLPGIRILPFRRLLNKENNSAKFSFAPRVDLLSVGCDIKGTTKEGITFLQAKKGPFAYFGLGAIELRFAIMMSLERVAFGAGIMFRNLRLSLGPKEEDDKKKDKKDSDEITGPLEDLLADEWVMVPEPEKPDKKTLKTRLRAKKQDKFSISVGYLSPLSAGSHGTLDIQLYDKKGNPGSIVWIPIDRGLAGIYLKQIGIGLEGVENVELSEGLSDDAKLTVALTGGLRWPIFEMGLIGAKLAIPLTNPRDMSFSLDGLDISLKLESVVISGSFLKSGIELAGMITIDLPKLSIGAMGFYGNTPVFDMESDPDIIKELKQGKVHEKLSEELKENEIELAADYTVHRHPYSGNWILTTKDNTYIFNNHDGTLHVLIPDRTFFIYGMVNSTTGGGISIGPIEFTGIALGGGVHRQVKVPSISEVADFPLVKMIMGKGGYHDDTSGNIVNQLSKPVKDPVEVFEKMKKWLPAKRGQYFVCAGVRFTIAKTIDCFALVIVQWGNEFELSLLGLARFRQPSDPSAKPICYVEMQILMTIKPSEGYFKLEAMLTSNSWVLNKDCKLTGGFALYIWFDGEHKDDFVFTIGGYHPRFKRPSHYPQVPRLGLNWPVNDNLSFKGNLYFAVTPSCMMIGARIEAVFHSGRVSAWFTAYMDAIISWSPLHLELDMGVSLKIEANFFLTSISITISSTIKMWGPPLGGLARVDISLLSLEIPFGAKREEAQPKVIDSWAQFCRTFLRADIEQKLTSDIMKASPMMQPNLSSGRSNLDKLKSAPQEEVAQDTPKPEVWKVRGDQLELAASAAVPVKTLNVGRVKTNSPPEGVQDRSFSGQSLQVKEPVVLDTDGLHTKNFNNALGVHPMGKSLDSVLNVTIVRDDVSQPVDLTGWTIEAETSSLPAALWDAEAPNLKAQPEPSAKLIPDCITGIKRLKPKGGEYGLKSTRSKMSWSPLEPAHVLKSGTLQQMPSETRSQDIQAAVAGKQVKQKSIADALSTAGFNLAWQPAQTEIRFRELQAEPMSGSVTTEA